MSEIKGLHKILSDLANDHEAPLEILFNHYYPRLYNFSKSILKIEDNIDDVLQEVFVKIWQNRKKIKTPETFNAFIYTITRNLLLNELRRQLNDQNAREEVKNRSLAGEYVFQEEVEYEELKEKIDIIVDELPERQREIFLLSRSDGLSHKEIAEKLDIKPKTVEYHITQSVRYLKHRLADLGIASVLCFYLFF
ncbi:RNA polymerase sigma-70 factor [Maribellus sp. YY47]|uniref:RNA polymerase sigma factor n=1 Tax=Maribellus sp. YY47 TaxID=2929486 RepID=UPI002001ABE0|nr:RNA polymerase sigma-70 factor [Maribellus sp. YY47]MCK3685601.1 RNA polymerase sigma-70 factor [Maribellus sp. YY47]